MDAADARARIQNGHGVVVGPDGGKVQSWGGDPRPLAADSPDELFVGGHGGSQARPHGKAAYPGEHLEGQT